MKVFVDTNLLIRLLNENYPPLENIKLVTFEKNIYEYSNGIKKLFWDRPFLISTLKGTGDQADYEHQYARKIVSNAAESKYFSKKDIIHALKTDYDLKFLYAITKEAVWQSEDDYRLSINHFCENGDIGVREILHMFFTRVNMQFLSFARILYSRLEKLGVRVLLYEEVFTDKEMALILRGHITDAYLPSSDLEIVLSCISSKCDIFLSTDEKLIDYCLTLGLNHGTKFAYVSSEDLNKLDEIILQYAHSG